MASRFARFGNDLYSGKKSYNFVGKWKLWMTIGVLTMVACGALIGLRGLNPSIEFRGGSQFQVSGLSDPDQSIAIRAVEETVGTAEAPRVSVIGGTSVQVQTGRLTDEQTNQLRDQLAEAYGVPVKNVTSSYVGASWGADVTKKALTGLLIFLVLVTVVITLYFRAWQMAVAAVVALIHDLVFTAGIYALVGFEVSPASVIGFLTILGYSLYDTVVVFDKIRENTAHVYSSTKRTYAEAVNLAVNQTLVRSINTSIVALLPVAAILVIGAYILGAGTLKDISLALFLGMLAGTYSSVFLAPPLLVMLRSRDPRIVKQAEAVAKARAGKPAKAVASRVGAVAVAEPHEALGDAPTDDDTEADDRPEAAARTAARGPRNQPKRNQRRPRGGR